MLLYPIKTAILELTRPSNQGYLTIQQRLKIIAQYMKIYWNKYVQKTRQWKDYTLH